MSGVAEYIRVEAEFAARTDALCQSTRPAECDCAVCPAREMCAWLIENDPFTGGLVL